MNQERDLQKLEQKIREFPKNKLAHKNYHDIHDNIITYEKEALRKEKNNKVVTKITVVFSSILVIFIFGIIALNFIDDLNSTQGNISRNEAPLTTEPNMLEGEEAVFDESRHNPAPEVDREVLTEDEIRSIVRTIAYEGEFRTDIRKSIAEVSVAETEDIRNQELDRLIGLSDNVALIELAESAKENFTPAIHETFASLTQKLYKGFD